MATPALQGQQRRQPKGQGIRRVHVEGPQHHLPGGTEEEEQDRRCQSKKWSDPAPGKLEEESGTSEPADDLRDPKPDVVGAGGREKQLVDQLANGLEMAVVRRKDPLQTVG